jgi:antirestriction protein ArdC
MTAQHIEKADVYQIITDRLLAILEAGTVPWRKPWNYGSERGPLNLVSKKHYQGINCFLLACTSFGSPYWLTFRQAQNLGGSVRKGAKGHPVIFWKMYEKEDSTAEDGKKRLPVLRYYTVFNVEQCEGVTVPAPDETTWHDHNPIEEAENVILFMPNRPTVEIGGIKACYSPSLDLVRVPEIFRYQQAEEYYSTFFHELAHSTGHESRLNREGVTGQHFFGDAVYSREELVAEMCAAFLCGQTGIENSTIQNSAAYLQSWIRTLRGDKKLAIVAAAQAQKAADYILNRKANQEDNQ